jgi:hypothetical protein
MGALVCAFAADVSALGPALVSAKLKQLEQVTH